jgi:hypothetical protein
MWNIIFSASVTKDAMGRGDVYFDGRQLKGIQERRVVLSQIGSAVAAVKVG